MIIDTLAHASQYIGLTPNLDRAIRYMMETDFAAMETGRYEVDGDNVYCMLQENTCKPPEDTKWEIHRDYIDIQLGLLDGEGIGYAPASMITRWEAYQSEKDVALSDDKQPGIILPLKKGTFVVLFPHDAHRPCIRLSEASNGRKIVLKIHL